MAISSGKRSFPEMTESKEFFKLEEPFLYSPIADTNVKILIEARDTSEVSRNFGSDECDQYCACAKWCTRYDNEDANGDNYIPACGEPYRDKQVYFKEIK